MWFFSINLCKFSESTSSCSSTFRHYKLIKQFIGVFSGKGIGNGEVEPLFVFAFFGVKYRVSFSRAYHLAIGSQKTRLESSLLINMAASALPDSTSF